jgi:AcrR family transcriptional regulator
MRTRARNQDDKNARRETILTAAIQLLAARPFAAVTMADVAQACGIAKGTLYLYFSTKEELFVAALERELERWSDALTQTLAGRDRLDPRSFAHVLTEALLGSPELVRLLALYHPLLEQNVPANARTRFEEVRRDRLDRVGTAIERTLQLRAGDGSKLVGRVHAFLAGSPDFASATPAGPNPRDELLDCVTVLSRGMLEPEPRQRAAGQAEYFVAS